MVPNNCLATPRTTHCAVAHCAPPCWPVLGPARSCMTTTPATQGPVTQHAWNAPLPPPPGVKSAKSRRHANNSLWRVTSAALFGFGKSRPLRTKVRTDFLRHQERACHSSMSWPRQPQYYTQISTQAGRTRRGGGGQRVPPCGKNIGGAQKTKTPAAPRRSKVPTAPMQKAKIPAGGAQKGKRPAAPRKPACSTPLKNRGPASGVALNGRSPLFSCACVGAIHRVYHSPLLYKK